MGAVLGMQFLPSCVKNVGSGLTWGPHNWSGTCLAQMSHSLPGRGPGTKMARPGTRPKVPCHEAKVGTRRARPGWGPPRPKSGLGTAAPHKPAVLVRWQVFRAEWVPAARQR